MHFTDIRMVLQIPKLDKVKNPGTTWIASTVDMIMFASWYASKTKHHEKLTSVVK